MGAPFPLLLERPDDCSFAIVEERIVEAVGFLDRHVSSGRYPFAGDGPWNLVVRDNRVAAQTLDAVADVIEPLTDEQVRRSGGLRSHEVDRMNATLGWIEVLPEGELRKLVHTVAYLKGREGPHVHWPDVRRRIGSVRSPDALRMRYSRSITKIAQALSR